MSVRVITGDCLEMLPTLDAESADSCVTDPPYGLSFMAKEWDHGIPGVPFWEAVLRVLKPGAHLVAFGGTRTHHRLMCAIEDAGFQLRDCLMWLYGSGFPKSHDISKGIDREAGAEREAVGMHPCPAGGPGHVMKTGLGPTATITTPATDAARRWAGWGTALKPAWEPIVLARKPFPGTVAANVVEHGTGGINVDGCRVGWQGDADKAVARPASFSKAHDGFDGKAFAIADRSHRDPVTEQSSAGRWPANVVLDTEAAAMLDEQSGELASGSRREGVHGLVGYHGAPPGKMPAITGDTGGASRFFYTAKASRAEREAGLSGATTNVNDGRDTPIDNPYQRGDTQRLNTHPTVKPLDLMQWLVRLVTPPGGTVLDPFCGSGSTLVAADRERFDAIGIELDEKYAAIARDRVTGDCPLFAEVTGE